jgi:hypothetical protein
LTVRINVVRRRGSTTLQHRHAHRIPHSTSVTTAKRPSCEAGRGHTSMISDKKK